MRTGDRPKNVQNYIIIIIIIILNNNYTASRRLIGLFIVSVSNYIFVQNTIMHSNLS